MASSDDFTKLSIERICAKVRNGNSVALEEMVRRNLYPADEIGYIAGGKVFIGMSDGGAYCALGKPESINKTRTANGLSMQVVFPAGRKIRYLYIDNGKVTAWQE